MNFELSTPPPPSWRRRIWREWCFARAVVNKLGLRFIVLVVFLLAGGTLFRVLEPEKQHSLARATYYTWSLIFGEPPEEFPASPVLQAMFFLMPIVGLLVILEGLLELAIMVRDRQHNEHSWCRIMAAQYNDHVILVGIGRLGYRTFLMLRALGQDVVVIERHAENQFLEDVRRDGSPLLLGDARRDTFLEDANVSGARSIVLATDDDLANLEVALDARRFNPKIRVVLRMFDQNMANKISDGFDIHLAMSPSSISAPAFATAAIEPGIINSVVVDGRLVVMQRWTVRKDGPLTGRTVGDLMDLSEMTVVEHKSASGDVNLFPPTKTLLEPGDDLVVQGPFEVISKLHEGEFA